MCFLSNCIFYCNSIHNSPQCNGMVYTQTLCLGNLLLSRIVLFYNIYRLPLTAHFHL